jgi:hypothetical protein
MSLGKSNYTWRTKGDLLLIVDMNTGERSVTNDIENVVNEIYQKLGDKIKEYKIIYKDSDGIWDGIIPVWSIKYCVECNFYHIGETDLKLAVQKIK